MTLFDREVPVRVSQEHLIGLLFSTFLRCLRLYKQLLTLISIFPSSLLRSLCSTSLAAWARGLSNLSLYERLLVVVGDLTWQLLFLLERPVVDQVQILLVQLHVEVAGELFLHPSCHLFFDLLGGGLLLVSHQDLHFSTRYVVVDIWRNCYYFAL